MTDTQDKWPFGPAPVCECYDGGPHNWRIIYLSRVYEPPLPTFECEWCAYKWTRRWTNAEFARFVEQIDESSRSYYAIGLGSYKDTPDYAPSPQV